MHGFKNTYTSSGVLQWCTTLQHSMVFILILTTTLAPKRKNCLLILFWKIMFYNLFKKNNHIFEEKKFHLSH